MPVCLAALDNWIQLALVLFFILGPLVGQLFKGNDEIKKPKPRARPDAPPPRPGENPPVAHGGDPARQLENEIEAFLRRNRGEPTAEGLPQAQPQSEPPHPSSVRAEPVFAEPIRSQPVSRDFLYRDSQVEVIAPEESVDEHVKRHLGSRPIGRESTQLGQRISQEIDGMEMHVHQAFDHSVGSLDKIATQRGVDVNDVDDRGTDSQVWEGFSGRQQREADAAAIRREAIRKMFSDPENVKQAVILNEILRRPKF